MEIAIPMSERVCVDCNSTKTHEFTVYSSYLQPHWYNDGNGNVRCKRCYASKKYRDGRILYNSEKYTHCDYCKKELKNTKKYCSLICSRKARVLR